MQSNNTREAEQDKITSNMAKKSSIYSSFNFKKGDSMDPTETVNLNNIRKKRMISMNEQLVPSVNEAIPFSTTISNNVPSMKVT
jgi:hypothetical protein